MTHPPDIRTVLESKKRDARSVLDHIPPGADVIAALGNGAPKTVIEAIEAGAEQLRDVRIHQMLPLRDHAYINGEVPNVRHVSWFLSPHDRAAFAAGKCDLVPNSFSDIPALMRRATKRSVAIAAAAAPDRHGYFSLSTHAEYTAAMIGEIPFFLEVNHALPRTFGENQVHVSQIVGWCEADYPMVELPPREPTDVDRRIAELIVERIPNGATVQAGIGSVPEQVLGMLADHRDLGVHTELFGDGFARLIECGAVTGTRKATHRNRAITTTVMGTSYVYDFVADNPGVELWPVDYVNDPRRVGREPNLTAINATLEVDFLGQAASESLGPNYWSSTGGQGDYTRAALYSENGQSFIVLHSTTRDESVSRIVPALHAGAALSASKNIVDNVVTEHGVAEMRGRSIRQRTIRLIEVAHPKFRDELTAAAKGYGYI